MNVRIAPVQTSIRLSGQRRLDNAAGRDAKVGTVLRVEPYLGACNNTHGSAAPLSRENTP